MLKMQYPKQWAFIAEHLFCSNLYQTTLKLFKKWFYDMPDIGTMKRIIEWFQMEYMLAQAPMSRKTTHSLGQWSI